MIGPTGHLGFVFFINNQGLYPFLRMFTCSDMINHNTEYGRYFPCSYLFFSFPQHYSLQVQFLLLLSQRNSFRKFTSNIFSLWKGKCKCTRVCTSVCIQLLNSSMWSTEKSRSAVSYWNVNCEAWDKYSFRKGIMPLATYKSIYNSKSLEHWKKRDTNHVLFLWEVLN